MTNHGGIQKEGVSGGTPPLISSSSLDPSKQTSNASLGEVISFAKWGRPEFDVQPATAAEQRFRHSGWSVRRAQIWAAFNRLHMGDDRRSRFANCGSGLWLQQNSARDDLKLACNTCHDRFCVPCAAARAARMAGVLEEKLQGVTARFVTLTLRHSRTPLVDQLARIGRSFTALRRRQFWTSAVDGGASFLEFKVGEQDGLWHVHLHILCTGRFVNQKRLSQEWHAVTGDSSIVDVRQVKDADHVAAYVTKYVTKPADASIYARPDLLDEMISGLSGRRLCATFGTWRGLKLDDIPEDTAGWCNIASVETLRSQAAAGDAEARRYLYAAARRWPLLAKVFAFDAGPAPPAP